MGRNKKSNCRNKPTVLDHWLAHGSKDTPDNNDDPNKQTSSPDVAVLGTNTAAQAPNNLANDNNIFNINDSASSTTQPSSSTSSSQITHSTNSSSFPNITGPKNDENESEKRKRVNTPTNSETKTKSAESTALVVVKEEKISSSLPLSDGRPTKRPKNKNYKTQNV